MGRRVTWTSAPDTDRHCEPEIRFDRYPGPRPCADHRVDPAAGRWRPDHGHRDRSYRPAADDGVERHARERGADPASSTCGTSCSSARDSRTALPTGTCSTASCYVVVDGLRRNHLVDPWPMLHASVNFWSASTPGRQSGHDAPLRGLHQGPERPERTLLRRPATRGAEGNGPDVERGAARPSDRASRTRRRRHRHRRPPPPTAGVHGDHITEKAIKDAFVGGGSLLTVGSSNAETRPGLFTLWRPCRVPRHCREGLRRSSNNDSGPNLGPTTSRSSSACCGTTAGVIGADHWGSDGRDRVLVRGAHPSSRAQQRPAPTLRGETRRGARVERASDGPRSAARPRTHRPAGSRATTSTGSSTCSRTNAHVFGLGDEYGEVPTKKGEQLERFEGTDTAPRSSPSRTLDRAQPCAKPARRIHRRPAG